MNASGRSLFISDCHLGTGSPEQDQARQKRLLSFLETEASQAETLYVLGDLFDFWFEYRHAIPRQHFQILNAMRGLVVAGVKIVYLGGNHDFWAGSFLRDEIGCQVHYHPTDITVQGRKLFLAHGDGMGKGERSYHFFRALLRHPWAITAYRSIHPDWGIPFAGFVSRTSRSHRDESKFNAEDLCNYLAEPQFSRGVDVVVIGHYHHPTHLRRGDNEFVILGDWIEKNTFAVLENSQFSLKRWTERGVVPLTSTEIARAS